MIWPWEEKEEEDACGGRWFDREERKKEEFTVKGRKTEVEERQRLV